MTHSNSISRTPSQTAFDRARDIYDSVNGVSKGDKRATAVLVDYFKSQPQEQRLAKGRGLVARAQQLPEPAARVGHAMTHSVSCSLTKTSQACAQARRLIDKLCIEREVRRFCEELERDLACHGLTMQQAADQALAAQRDNIARVRAQLGAAAPDYPEPHIELDLLAVLRESAALDEAVLVLANNASVEQIEALLGAYTPQIDRLVDRMHGLESDLKRVYVTVGPGAEVAAFSADEKAAYARLLAWAEVAQPGLHARLLRLDDIPDEVRAQVPAAQLQAFVALTKRAAMALTHKAFQPREMDALHAFRASRAWRDLEPLAQAVETLGKLALLHVSAPLVSLRISVAQACVVDAAGADGRPSIPFCDNSAQPRGSAQNMEAQPFYGLGSDDGESQTGRAPA